LVVDKFEEVIKNPPPTTVAVIGGTSKDIEVQILLNNFPNIEISYFGIDNPYNDGPFQYFDLNLEQNIDKSFSLVICSQVIEHVHNLEEAFRNITNLSSENGGCLWINCPASNMPHGSPGYYAAGYSKELIEEYLLRNNKKIIESGYFGSKRYIFFIHSLHFWATKREHSHPIIGYEFKQGSILGKMNKYRKEILWRFISLLFSKKTRTDLDFATEVYVYARSV
jgi:SAM-dependent methyltransferase